MRRYNLTYLKEISGGDEDFILDMIQTFVSNAPSDIAHLKKLAAKGDWNELGENAHKFAPGLQFMGIVSLRPVINQIEDFSFARKNLAEIPGLLQKLESECQMVSEELKQDFKI